MFCYAVNKKDASCIVSVFENEEDAIEYIEILEYQGQYVNDLRIQKVLYVPDTDKNEKLRSTYIK